MVATPVRLQLREHSFGTTTRRPAPSGYAPDQKASATTTGNYPFLERGANAARVAFEVPEDRLRR